jgi:hypothetical protein
MKVGEFSLRQAEADGGKCRQPRAGGSMRKQQEEAKGRWKRMKVGECNLRQLAVGGGKCRQLEAVGGR